MVGDQIMNLEELKNFCNSMRGTTYDFPFDDVTLVYRVGNKMFALVRIDEDPVHINLKCDPLMSQDLRIDYPAIIPGYHMNKKYWNTLILDGSLENGFVKNLIRISYDIVFNGLTRKEREAIITM
jgi:predicted DNA-binding protein (MmcQ/YjbR family)